MGQFLKAAIIMTIVGMVMTAKDRMCPGNKKPLKEGGLQLFCGRGPNRQECPEGSTCVIDPADGYAVCCPSASVECKKGQHYVQCKKNPCDGAKCDRDPEAICIPDYCGGCNTRWYKSTARLHKCGTQGEFDCSVPVLCLVNPCTVDKSCDKYDGQKVCYPNYCYGCNTMWFKTKARIPQCDSDFKGNKKD